jgi:alpha-L-rhamnosidase
VLDYIVSLGVSSSIILSKYVIEQLFRFHREKAALSYIFDDNRGWGHIIRSGSQTMWEGFDDIESHSHAWGLYPIRLIQEYLMGIPAGKSVDETWLIKPQFTDMIKDLSVSVITDKGILSLSYVIEGNHVHFRYNIPKNMDVLLCINKQSIRLNGSDELSIII